MKYFAVIRTAKAMPNNHGEYSAIKCATSISRLRSCAVVVTSLVITPPERLIKCLRAHQDELAESLIDLNAGKTTYVI